MDIAVVKLARAVDYRTGTNLELRNIPLDGSFIGGGVDVTIAGWGKEDESCTYTNLMQTDWTLNLNCVLYTTSL